MHTNLFTHFSTKLLNKVLIDVQTEIKANNNKYHVYNFLKTPKLLTQIKDNRNININ